MGALLRSRRVELGLTQPELARMLFTSKSTLSRAENGVRLLARDLVEACDGLLGAAGYLLDAWEGIVWGEAASTVHVAVKPPESVSIGVARAPIPTAAKAWTCPVPLTALGRVRDGLAALGTHTAAASPALSGGIHVPAALLPDVFVPQGPAPGGTIWFGFNGRLQPTREPSSGWFAGNWRHDVMTSLRTCCS